MDHPGAAAGDGNTPGAGPAGGEGAAGAQGDQGKPKKKKDKLECGENGSYGDLKKKTGGGEFDRDHVPSKASLKERARQTLTGGEKLCPDQARAVDNLASAIAIPKAIHSGYSPTYGGRNSPDRILDDALNPQKAARRDTAKVLNGMKKDGVSKECRKKYAEWAKKVNNTTPAQYDEMLKKATGK